MDSDIEVPIRISYLHVQAATTWPNASGASADYDEAKIMVAENDASAQSNLMTDLPAAPPRNEVDIGVFDQLMRFNVQTLHECAHLATRRIRRLTVGHYSLEFEKMSELVDLVEVNASSSDHEQDAKLSDAANLAVCQ